MLWNGVPSSRFKNELKWRLLCMWKINFSTFKISPAESFLTIHKINRAKNEKKSIHKLWTSFVYAYTRWKWIHFDLIYFREPWRTSQANSDFLRVFFPSYFLYHCAPCNSLAVLPCLFSSEARNCSLWLFFCENPFFSSFVGKVLFRLRKYYLQ